MNPAYISAFSALLGAMIGGLASFSTSWLTQRNQLRFTHREAIKTKREALYAEFVTEGSRLLADAYSHQKEDVEDLVNLYAISARIRLVSPQPVVVAAEQILSAVVEAYLGPNYTLRDLLPQLQERGLHLFVDFAEACRRDLDS